MSFIFGLFPYLERFADRVEIRLCSSNGSYCAQLMSETRTFTGVGAFTHGSDYNLAGELKKITDAANMTIT